MAGVPLRTAFDPIRMPTVPWQNADVAARLDYRIDDRYRRDEGTVFLSGAQALARVPLEQLRIDRRLGWNTAAYVTGYPGSPLAGFDRDVTAAATLAEADGYRYVFQPGMNEELAATAVMGAQLSSGLRSAQYDGVIGCWYGKGPGLDRASDALRHAVMAGVSARGGAVALVGEDPSAKSSTLPTSSDVTLVDLRIPMLCPGDVQETVDLGRHAIAMSRASGAWTAIRIVEVVADGTGTVELHPERIVPVIPTVEIDGRPFVPHADGQLLTPHTIRMEAELHYTRLDLARRYGVDNGLNRITVRGPSDWIGIVATGHTFHEVREALAVLGLRTDDDLRSAGVRLLQVLMPWPLDPAVVREFGHDLAEVVVVEDKNQTLELAVTAALYPLATRPVVAGRRTPDGHPLMPSTGSLSADAIATQLRTRLVQRIAGERLDAPTQRAAALAGRRIPLSVNRTPYFCSGCPHNTSTQAPEGHLVGAGIGCHTMVALMEPGRYGEIVGVTAMGCEGAQWFGMAPFVGDEHLVQNIGDGTLFHSGLTAVRAAVANGANITYKVLYNGTVAMTGGQDPFGQLDVPHLAQVFLSEGVRRVLVTTDDVSRYRSGERAAAMPTGVEVWDRSRIVEAQEVLARVPGTTVLIHDQRCAAEKRRDRKRGRIADPGFKVVIAERVCEGCGDCGAKSNCLSVVPTDTAFGRKTRIDQGSCNLDASCLQGDCPSFLTVRPSRRARAGAATSRRPKPPTIDVASLPDPQVMVPTDRCTIRLSGIGGTGVVTVSQVLGTAAMLDGFDVRGLDQTGLSQKAGPVVSDVRLSRGGPQASNRATLGSVDTLLAFDLLVAASDTHLGAASPERTRVAASTAAVATGSMVVHPDTPYPMREAVERIGQASRSFATTDAITATTTLLGDPATANVYLLGFALQHGLVPVSVVSIERAIELNGVAVGANLAAFRAGRQAAAGANAEEVADSAGESTAALVDRLAADLRGYQSTRYAQRFRDVVARAQAVGSIEFTEAVAVHLHKLMAYKDEYEVARLLLAPEARAAAEAVAGPGARVTWNLHPPALRALGMQRKLRLGRWATPLFLGLRAGRRLRGTPFDAFGWASLRRLERTLRDEYIAAVDTLVAALGPSPHPERLAEAVAIASLPDRVRGYEHLKRERGEAYRTEFANRLSAFTA
jgi:indolepyruvate ferredoxin oxidoreductase